MCRSCAVTRGYASEGEGLGASPASGTCPACGWTAASIRSSGRLGCSDCAIVFRREILSALKRSGSHGPYEGKVPHRGLAGTVQEASITALSAALERAIRSEDFEEAATIRDRIRAGTGSQVP